MLRSLVIGAIAVGGAVAAERLFAGLGKDIARYDAIRKMSGQEPLAKEILATLGGVLGGSMQSPTSFMASLTNDVVRYAKMKGM